jgi:hypothetical protein
MRPAAVQGRSLCVAENAFQPIASKRLRGFRLDRRGRNVWIGNRFTGENAERTRVGFEPM